jgi:hypothetical protein
LPLPTPPPHCRRLQRHALPKLPPPLQSWLSPPRCRRTSAATATTVTFDSIVIDVPVIIIVSIAVDAAAFG